MLCYTHNMASDDLLTRGVEKVIPKKLAEEKLKAGNPLRVYLGIDPTGTKLHLGHSVPLRKLQQFADAGHHVIFLIGSFTAMIGDPSGQDKLRAPLTREEVEQNFETYKIQASKILDFDTIQIVFNHEWLEKLRTDDMLKILSNFTMQQMSQRDMFERRTEKGDPVHLHEFLYPALVGYDSVMLDVDCELGGSDQEFNMLAGRTLQEAYGKREKFVLTTKLINGLDGQKMSKTYDNCVYLEDEPNEMYGKLMSLNDELMETYFECCTDVDLKEVKKLLKGNPRDAKAHLAREIVTIYHDKAAAKSAEEHFQTVHKDKGVPEDVPEVTVEEGSTLVDVLVKNKLAPSKSEARRLIEQGGVKVNDEVVTSVDAVVEGGVVKVGKRKFLRISVT